MNRDNHHATYVLFSISGFTDGLIEHAEDNDVILISTDHLIGKVAPPTIDGS